MRRQHLNVEQPEAALKEYALAAIKDPENEALVLEVSRRFLQNKQPEKALEVLSRAAARPNASAAVLARLGIVYSQLGKADQAVTACRAAVKKAPGSLIGYQNLLLIVIGFYLLSALLLRRRAPAHATEAETRVPVAAT